MLAPLGVLAFAATWLRAFDRHRAAFLLPLYLAAGGALVLVRVWMGSTGPSEPLLVFVAGIVLAFGVPARAAGAGAAALAAASVAQVYFAGCTWAQGATHGALLGVGGVLGGGGRALADRAAVGLYACVERGAVCLAVPPSRPVARWCGGVRAFVDADEEAAFRAEFPRLMRPQLAPAGALGAACVVAWDALAVLGAGAGFVLGPWVAWDAAVVAGTAAAWWVLRARPRWAALGAAAAAAPFVAVRYAGLALSASAGCGLVLYVLAVLPLSARDAWAAGAAAAAAHVAWTAYAAGGARARVVALFLGAAWTVGAWARYAAEAKLRHAFHASR